MIYVIGALAVLNAGLAVYWSFQVRELFRQRNEIARRYIINADAELSGEERSQIVLQITNKKE